MRKLITICFLVVFGAGAVAVATTTLYKDAGRVLARAIRIRRCKMKSNKTLTFCLGFLVLLVLSSNIYAAVSPIAGENITTSAASAYAAYFSTIYAINGAGLDESSLHVLSGGNNSWMSAYGGGGSENPNPGTRSGISWYRSDFDQTYTLDSLRVWNYNGSGQWTAIGCKKVYIEYTTDGSTWTTLMDDANDYWIFAEAPGTADYAYNTDIDFGGVDANCVVITMDSSDGGWDTDISLDRFGLAEIMFMADVTQATAPIPRDGGRAHVIITLSWLGIPGTDADIYFGADFNGVNDADTGSAEYKGTQTDPNASYYIKGLEYNTNYYWRIDTVDGGSTAKGTVWSFKTVPNKSIYGFDTTISAASKYPGDEDYFAPYYTMDGSGLNLNAMEHALNTGGTGWMSAKGGGGAANPNPGTRSGISWIRFDFDQIYTLNDFWVWNYVAEGHWTSIGCKKVYIEYTTDGSTWTTLMDDANDFFIFAEAPGTAGDMPHSTEIDFGGVDANSVVITMDANDGGWDTVDSEERFGLSEVKFFSPDAPAACDPRPTADLNMDCVVDMRDFALFAQEWLECGRQPQSECP